MFWYKPLKMESNDPTKNRNPPLLLTWVESNKQKARKYFQKKYFQKLNAVGTGLPKGLKHSSNIEGSLEIPERAI